MKKTLLMLALVAGITSFAQNATAAIVYNPSPGFSQSGGFFGTYNMLGNPDPNGGGFYLLQNAVFVMPPDPPFDDGFTQESSSRLSSYSDSHFIVALVDQIVDASLVPSSNTGIDLSDGTRYVAFDVKDQSNSNAVYYGWMNVTVVGANTTSTDPNVRFTLNSYAYDNTGGSIPVGAVPEPSTYALLGIGAMGLLMVLRKKKTA